MNNSIPKINNQSIKELRRKSHQLDQQLKSKNKEEKKARTLHIPQQSRSTLFTISSNKGTISLDSDSFKSMCNRSIFLGEVIYQFNEELTDMKATKHVPDCATNESITSLCTFIDGWQCAQIGGAITKDTMIDIQNKIYMLNMTTKELELFMAKKPL